MKGKFFGLLFTDGLINVRVLESVEEHRQEGNHMHHCVFSASYYLNEESLIFSATIRSTFGRFARRRMGREWRQWSSALTSSEWCRAEVSATRTPNITTAS